MSDSNLGSTWDRSQVEPRIVTLPIPTKSVLNLREHWAARHRRAKAQRQLVRLLWPWKRRSWIFPLGVHLVRLKPSGRLLDDDNLRAALKAVRDQVAAELGVDDGDRQRISWTYGEERGPWGVRIEIREATR